jgi:hypothetical protein
MSPRVTLAFALVLAAGCGHRGNPLPPLRKTPPPLAGFRLAQRGDTLEVAVTAPRASVDGVAYEEVTVEFLYGEGQIDLQKGGSRRAVRTEGGRHVVETLPLPAPGTLVRAAARAVSGSAVGPRTLIQALVAQAPLEAPRELKAEMLGGGVALAWQGQVPEAVPPPVLAPPPGPGLPGLPGQTPSTPGAPAATPGAPPTTRAATPPAPSPVTPPTVPPAAPQTIPPATPPAPPPETPPAGRPTGPGGTPAPASAAAGAVEAGTQPAAGPEALKAPASGFFIYRRIGDGPFAGPLLDAPLEERTHTDTAAPLGTSTCYVVRAVGSVMPLIESAPSNEACVDVRDIAAPATPAGLAILPHENGLEVLWSPSPEPDLAGYRLYRRAGKGAAEKLAELPPDKTSFLDATAKKGLVYRYSLSAFDQAGNESTPSAAAEGTLP